GGGAEVIAPHVLEDLRAGEHLARVAQEHLQQQELGAGELEQALTPPGLASEAVQAHVLEAEREPALVVLTRPAQQRAQPREQLPQRKRFDEVVVGAGVALPRGHPPPGGLSALARASGPPLPAAAGTLPARPRGAWRCRG